MYMESENGRSLWHWYFGRGYPTAVECVDVDTGGGLRQFRFRLAGPGDIEYRLTAVVSRGGTLVRLYW